MKPRHTELERVYKKGSIHASRATFTEHGADLIRGEYDTLEDEQAGKDSDWDFIPLSARAMDRLALEWLAFRAEHLRLLTGVHVSSDQSQTEQQQTEETK